MKKLFFSLILCFLLLGTSISFSACKKDEFKLSELNNKYESAIKNYENVEITNNGLNFVYNQKFTHEINNNLPYKNIKDFYAPMFDYSTSFINGFIKKCSNDEIKTTKKQRKNIENALNNFVSAIGEVDSNISNVEVLINIDPASTSAYLKLQGLFSAYENLYKSTFELSNHLQQIYFDYADDYNTNPSSTTLDKFNIDNHIVLLNAKISSAKVESAEAFVEKYIKNQNLSTKLTEKTLDTFNSVPTDFASFNNKIKSIDKHINSLVASKIIKENSTKKQNFYNYCIEVYSIELSLSDHKPMFDDAKNSIVYRDEKDNINITYSNKMKLESIDRYELLTNEYIDSLAKIITLLEI